MDVIGNNIANVNTVGFKASRVIFQDVFNQTVAGGTANAAFEGRGGTNPIQIGLGMRLASIDMLHNPAPIARTDNPFDMMISGEGVFMVERDGEVFFTRAGNFSTDSEGFLVTSDGFFVLAFSYDGDAADLGSDAWMVFDAINTRGGPNAAWMAQLDDGADLLTSRWETGDLARVRLVQHPLDAAGDPDDDYEVRMLGFQVGQDGSISVLIDGVRTNIAYIAVAQFSNPGGLETAGNSLFRMTPSSGQPLVTVPGGDGSGPILAGGLEMSAVDLATEFTEMIVTQRGFQANSRIITVSDTMLEELVNLKR